MSKISKTPHGIRRIKASQFCEMCERKSKGESWESIAASFGVHSSTLRWWRASIKLHGMFAFCHQKIDIDADEFTKKTQIS